MEINSELFSNDLDELEFEPVTVSDEETSNEFGYQE